MKNYLTIMSVFLASALAWADEVATEAAAAVDTAAAEAGPATTEAAKQSGGMNPLFMMIILLVAMYFLMIAPQRKQKKQREQMMAALKEGDRIMTQSGLYGVVKKIKDESVRLMIDDQTKTTIEISKNAIAMVINPPEADKAEEKK
ncbi:preprotein translocase subunit YajC [bacterium]|nr:preprotein translocase subunit YajC [bacterium]